MCWRESRAEKRYENDRPMMLDSENQGVTGQSGTHDPKTCMFWGGGNWTGEAAHE